MRKGVRGPFDQAHRIPFGLKQFLKIPTQRRVCFHDLLSPTPCLADPPLNPGQFSLELFDPSLHRFPIRSGERGYLADTAIADLECFCSQEQSPLPFI